MSLKVILTSLIVYKVKGIGMLFKILRHFKKINTARLYPRPVETRSLGVRTSFKKQTNKQTTYLGESEVIL